MSKKEESMGVYPARYQKLQRELAQTGWVALGTLLERGVPSQGGLVTSGHGGPEAKR